MRQDKQFGRVGEGETAAWTAGGDEDALPRENVHRLREIVLGHAEGGRDVTHPDREGVAMLCQIEHGLQRILCGATEPHDTDRNGR